MRVSKKGSERVSLKLATHKGCCKSSKRFCRDLFQPRDTSPLLFLFRACGSQFYREEFLAAAGYREAAWRVEATTSAVVRNPQKLAIRDLGVLHQA